MKLTKETLTEMIKETIKEQMEETPPETIRKALTLMKKAKQLLETYHYDLIDVELQSWATEEILSHLKEAIDRTEKYYG